MVAAFCFAATIHASIVLLFRFVLFPVAEFRKGFTVLHLTKGWALAGMIPIIFGAGILLGSLALSSGSLIPCMIGHTIMDVGLFAYWWTGIAGEFTLRPIGETGVDRAFVIACIAACTVLAITLLAIWRLRSLR
jgi:hypothetical protein